MYKATIQILLLLGFLSACADLDANVHNRRHCTAVTEATCTADLYWDRLCTACEDDYEFNRDYEWMEGTLEPGQTLREFDLSTIAAEELATDVGDGTLFVYFIPSHGENASLTNTTIVYNNGNFASVEHYIPRYRFLHDAGYNLVVWDYRGYGKSLPDQDPVPKEFLSDARQVWAWAKTVVPDADRMISYGYSLGGVPAVEMVMANDSCALFMEAAFPSISAITKSASGLNFGEGFLSAGQYNNIEKLRSYTRPAFFFHGDADVKFPLWASKEMYASAKGPKDFWTVIGVGHSLSTGGIPEAGLNTYLGKLFSFLEDHAPDCLSP
ncbi:MAG: hypothetical protein CMH54_09740 [Myxococcales bacterium]|nr:hypothetical protein [Myxococcales bacterium]